MLQIIPWRLKSLTKSCLSAVNGNGWCVRRGVMLRKVPRELLSMLNAAKPRPWRSSSDKTGEIHSFGVFAPGRRGAGASRFGLPPDTGSNKGRGRTGGFVLASGFGRRSGFSVKWATGLPLVRGAVKKSDKIASCWCGRPPTASSVPE